MEPADIPAAWLLAIPPAYLVAIIGVLGVIVGSSWIVWALKRLTGLPTPEDSVARQRWFKVLKVLDYVASNSATVKSWFVELQHQRDLAEQRRALAAQHKALELQQSALAEQEHIVDNLRATIVVQADAIRASQRPPARDAEIDTSRQTPAAKRKP